MRHHRKRCLRCGTPLPALKRAAAGKTRPSWLAAHRRAVAGLAGLVLVVAVAGAIARYNRAPDAVPKPRAVQAAAPAVGPDVRPPAIAPGQPPLPDPEFVGRIAYREGNYEAAYERYREALTRNPNDAESSSNCGQALVRLGRPAEAIALFERAIALNQRRWAYHFNLAHACGLLAQWDRAIEEYRAASELFPDDHVTEYNLGMALHKRGDETTAVEHLRRAIELAPDEADFYLSFGISSERLGRTADALDGYRRYLELAPAAPNAGQVRARVDLLAGPAPAPAAVPAPPPAKSGTS